MKQKQRHSIALLGGDQRQIHLVKALTQRRRALKVWGLPLPDEIRVTQCKEWREAIQDATCIILPLPASRDDIRINAPFVSIEEAPQIDALLSESKQKLILGGKLSQRFLQIAECNGHVCYDYFLSEVLQLKNALLTAEGAIEIAMRELPVALDGTKISIVGYGRIGELLAKKLRGLGAKVTVYARREEVLARVELAHCEARSIRTASALGSIDPETRILFNTVPEILFKDSVLESFPKGCIFIDLASAPGGIDTNAAQAQGIRSFMASALPGKYAPETAGIILAQTIDSYIERIEDT